jgi:hypothetical protein
LTDLRFWNSLPTEARERARDELEELLVQVVTAPCEGEPGTTRWDALVRLFLRVSACLGQEIEEYLAEDQALARAIRKSQLRHVSASEMAN